MYIIMRSDDDISAPPARQCGGGELSSSLSAAASSYSASSMACQRNGRKKCVAQRSPDPHTTAHKHAPLWRMLRARERPRREGPDTQPIRRVGQRGVEDDGDRCHPARALLRPPPSRSQPRGARGRTRNAKTVARPAVHPVCSPWRVRAAAHIVQAHCRKLAPLRFARS